MIGIGKKKLSHPFQFLFLPNEHLALKDLQKQPIEFLFNKPIFLKIGKKRTNFAIKQIIRVTINPFKEFLQL